jgi:hypothetical protein
MSSSRSFSLLVFLLAASASVVVESSDRVVFFHCTIFLPSRRCAVTCQQSSSLNGGRGHNTSDGRFFDMQEVVMALEAVETEK